ncbi:MAG: putative inorganic carbon (HCO3(-)) transporter [Lentimonas sp.]|jgi:putative inorganic carbon (HCO3(-)) transporter
MSILRSNIGLIILATLYIALSGYFIWEDQAYFALASVGLLFAYFAVFNTEYSFLSLAFLTPLSINIEEYTDGFGLFLPTEPILFGLLILIVFKELKRPFIPKHVWHHPIVIAVGLYLVWLSMSTISSSDPVASLKSILAKLWFLAPLLLIGPIVFSKRINIKAFLWLFLVGMVVAILYTVLHHAMFSFGEKEGHWVMWPFFKDHTIYGAMVAFTLLVALGLYFSKKHPPLTQLVLLIMILIVLVGLYFSYTRAAWLSVVGALLIGVVIKLKIKFKWLLGVGVFAGLVLFFSWDQIQMEMARNTSEHTTEDFGKRIQSAANVTTDASNLERLNRWSCAISMFKERPIMGFGPGTYAFEYARFQQPENLTIISTNFGDAGNAHSEYLGALAETGALGLVFFLLILIAVFYKGVMLYIKIPEGDKEMKMLIFFLVLALSSYFIHGLLNNYLDTDKASVPIWGICAIFIAVENSLKNKISLLKEA